MATCPTCGGSGLEFAGRRRIGHVLCPLCDGQGDVPRARRDALWTLRYRYRTAAVHPEVR